MVSVTDWQISAIKDLKTIYHRFFPSRFQIVFKSFLLFFALLTSDRGVQFMSSVWSEVCSVLGISHIQTTSYQPQSNGMIEGFTDL